MRQRRTRKLYRIENEGPGKTVKRDYGGTKKRRPSNVNRLSRRRRRRRSVVSVNTNRLTVVGGRRSRRSKRKAQSSQSKQPKAVSRKTQSTYNYKIAIPTYHRLDIFTKKTYGKVIKPNKLDDRVVLFLQNPEDIKAYRERFPQLKIVKSPPGYHPTLNYMSKYFGKNVRYVKMDDDLSGFFTGGGFEGGTKVKPVKNVRKLFDQCFREMDKKGANLGGFYPSANWFRGPKVSTDLRFIMGACYCVRNQKIFLPEANSKSDFELTIKYYQKDHTVVRMNRYGFRTAYNAGDGGVTRTDESENRDNERLMKKYPAYIKRAIKHKTGTTSLVLNKNPIL